MLPFLRRWIAEAEAEAGPGSDGDPPAEDGSASGSCRTRHERRFDIAVSPKDRCATPFSGWRVKPMGSRGRTDAT